MRQQILELMASVLQVPIEKITEDTKMEDLEEWDSLMHVMLIGEIETRFGISISLEKSIEITCVKELIDLCEM